MIRTGGRVRARRSAMLYTIAVVLILLWALGLVSSVTLGGYIHVLIAIALAIILVRMFEQRKSDPGTSRASLRAGARSRR